MGAVGCCSRAGLADASNALGEVLVRRTQLGDQLVERRQPRESVYPINLQCGSETKGNVAFIYTDTQTQTQTQTQAQTRTHRHTDTQAHRDTETQRHRDILAAFPHS